MTSCENQERLKLINVGFFFGGGGGGVPKILLNVLKI